MIVFDRNTWRPDFTFSTPELFTFHSVHSFFLFSETDGVEGFTPLSVVHKKLPKLQWFCFAHRRSDLASPGRLWASGRRSAGALLLGFGWSSAGETGGSVAGVLLILPQASPGVSP